MYARATTTAPRGDRSSARRRDLPDVLGRFEVRGLLGEGGMGRVLHGWDPELGRTVAIKLIEDDAANDRRALDRAVEEVRISAQLEHPNIVPVYDVGVSAEGDLYFVMRRVQGTSLDVVLRGLREGDAEMRRRWTPKRLLAAFASLCHAVAYAHQHGVVHRDIKPANVMMGSFGEVQLLDWGVAGRVHGRSDDDGPVLGTPGYISPEQLLAPFADVDVRSDVWGLGALLYEVVTLRRAMPGSTAAQLFRETAVGAVVDPRLRAPEAGIPAEIARLCMRAMSPRPSDRPDGAAAIASHVERFLDGAERRHRALAHLAEAQELWSRHVRMQARKERLTTREAVLGETTPPWLPLEEKRELLELRRDIAQLEPERAALFGRAVGRAERALSQDPGNVDVRRFLARAFWSRFLEAEDRGDFVGERYFAERVAEYDDGSLAVARRGAGRLTLRTSPPGAEVVARRVDREPIPWALLPEVSLGRTPLEAVPLEMGSYVLTLRAPGYDDTTYPVIIERSGHWTSGGRPVRLAPPGLGERGFAFVAEGRCRLGGDPGAQDSGPARDAHVPAFAMAVFPITQGEYCEFVNDLASRDPEEAWRRSPRQDLGVNASSGQYWERPEGGGRYVVPERDRDGDRWNPRWPVFGVSREDADAYVAWRSERDGCTYRLPTEEQWEKAARGVDGRRLPWGDVLDPSLCAMRASFPGRPQPRSVGLFPTDRSVYGVRDMAGGMRDWCGGERHDGDCGRRPIRGGSWDSAAEYCLVAYRAAYIPTYVGSSIGFRLTLDLEDQNDAGPPPGGDGPEPEGET